MYKRRKRSQAQLNAIIRSYTNKRQEEAKNYLVSVNKYDDYKKSGRKSIVV